MPKRPYIEGDCTRCNFMRQPCPRHQPTDSASAIWQQVSELIPQASRMDP